MHPWSRGADWGLGSNEIKKVHTSIRHVYVGGHVVNAPNVVTHYYSYMMASGFSLFLRS